MSRFSWIFPILLSWAALSIACQSEDEKRADRLREKLHQDIKQIEIVNNKILAAREALYKLKQQHKDRKAAHELHYLERDREKFPAELAELQSKIDTTPNASLMMLSSGIQSTLEYHQNELKQIQSYSDSYVERWSPEAIKKDNEEWRKAWQPKIFSGRPEGPVTFGDKKRE
jgi:acyl-CoA hydrolase